MSEPTGLPAADLAAPAALAAFLRGVERRGAVLAELQSGDPTLGDAALTRTLAAFRPLALQAPMAEWPALFWAELLGQPALRRAVRARPPAFLPQCTPPVRAALLLKLAAGLDDSQAARVLDVAEGSLRSAVARAAPRGSDGALDPLAWTQMQAEVQQRIRGLSTERGMRLARMREAALTAPAERFFPTQHHRIPRRALAVAAAGAIALAGTWAFEYARGDAQVRVEPLGRAGAPASTFDAEAARITHPDFDLLADPDSEALARNVAFLSWVAGRDAVAAAPAMAPDAELARSAPEAPGAESTDAP